MPTVSGGDNLVGTGGSRELVNGVNGNIVGVADPLLAPLGNYGGPTQTVALLPGSPAIGAGIAVTGVTTDQRGEPLDSPNPDIGAFRSQGRSPSLPLLAAPHNRPRPAPRSPILWPSPSRPTIPSSPWPAAS